MNNIDSHIEALLFLKGEPMTIKELAKILAVKESDVKIATGELDKKLVDRGIVLVQKEDSYMLATSSKSSEFAKILVKEEFNPELTKASLEVISIVAYRGPISRAEIDYIRGVNSTFILRNLLVRGLIERIPNPRDSRSFIYKLSFQLLEYLGIKKINDLPEFGEFNKKIEDFIKENDNSKEENNISNSSV
ncbi:SMC-Scp complex subunit ScpB [Patescibacteria group bacterium]|nr:SMC-Scp complex subunit ScpB [Patescibacteria group bacterium]